MATTNWLDPNWRYEVSNAVMAWIVIGILAACFGLAWLAIKQIPRSSLFVSISGFAVLGGLLGAGVWLVSHRTVEPLADLATDPTKGRPYFVLEFSGWVETDRQKEMPMFYSPQFSFRNKGDRIADRVTTRFIVMQQSFIDSPLSAPPSEVPDVLPDGLNTFSVAPIDLSSQPPLFFVFGLKYQTRHQLWFLRWDGIAENGAFSPRFASASINQESAIRAFLLSRNITLD